MHLTDEDEEQGLTTFRFGTEQNNSVSRERKEDDEDDLSPKQTYVKARTLQDALEHFCSTCTEMEQHVGREIFDGFEPATIPRGYTAFGEKFDRKPMLDATKNLPDREVIQVWVHDENAPHWFYGKTSENLKGADKLVLELPLKDAWGYDKWGNLDHPALPAPAAGNVDIGTDIELLGKFKGRNIRTLSRSDIAFIKGALKTKRNELEAMAGRLNDGIYAMEKELEFRSEQLKFLSLYLRRNVEIKLVNKGPKAPDADLVHVRQRVLYMAEEVGVIQWNAEAGFDFRNIEDFDRWVTSPKNLGIIAPEPKCIVALKPRRSDFDYGDPMINWFMNRENRKVYFLLRNGDTIYRAHLEIAIADRLFPEEEKFEKELERRRDSRIGDVWPFGWDWKPYAEKWAARKKWYAKGFTDADFAEAIPYRTKEEMLAAKAKEEARIAERKANPKEMVEMSKWDLQDVYESYNKDLKQFFFGLAFIQGILDGTDIFGHLDGKVNVFTGFGLEKHAKLVYDMSEERMLPDRATKTLVQWLKSEARKVKVGDYVIVRATKSRGWNQSELHVRGVAQVLKVKAPGMVAARMNRETWRYWDKQADERRMGIVHRLSNRGDDERDDEGGIQFYPWNLPLDKLKFYVERRAERDKYWDNLLVDLMALRSDILQGKKPILSKCQWEQRINAWRDGE